MLDPSTGIVRGDAEKLLHSAILTLYHFDFKTGNLANAEPSDYAKARETLRKATDTQRFDTGFEAMAGHAPKGYPVGITVDLPAHDSAGATAALCYVVALDVPSSVMEAAKTALDALGGAMPVQPNATPWLVATGAPAPTVAKQPAPSPDPAVLAALSRQLATIDARRSALESRPETTAPANSPLALAALIVGGLAVLASMGFVYRAKRP